MSRPPEPVESCLFLNEKPAAFGFGQRQTREFKGAVFVGVETVDFMRAVELAMQGDGPAHKKQSGTALGKP